MDCQNCFSFCILTNFVFEGLGRGEWRGERERTSSDIQRCLRRDFNALSSAFNAVVGTETVNCCLTMGTIIHYQVHPLVSGMVDIGLCV